MTIAFDICYTHPNVFLGIGHLHLVILLHIMHSSDIPLAPPVHIDQVPLPGLLAH